MRDHPYATPLPGDSVIFNDPATKEEAFSVLRDKEDITDAAATGSAKLVEMLLMAGVNVDTKTSGGYTPLLIAAGRGRTEVVKFSCWMPVQM